MKNILIIFCIIFSVAGKAQTKKTTLAQKKVSKQTVTKPAFPLFKNSVDSFSYAIGLEGAAYYKSQGAKKINSVFLVHCCSTNVIRALDAFDEDFVERWLDHFKAVNYGSSGHQSSQNFLRIGSFLQR